jgi:hypothetical protein
MSTYQDGWPRTLAELASTGGLLALSKPAKPPKPPKPTIAFAEDTDTAIRDEFKRAGLPRRAAEAFLEMIPGLLASDRDIARNYGAGMAGFKRLRGNRGAKAHIRDARKALAEALVHLSETKYWPARLAEHFRADRDAIGRTLLRLDAIARSLKADQRRQPKRDMYKDFALISIAECFAYYGLRLSTAPKGMFATVAEILLDKNVNQRDLDRAIKKITSEKR